MSRRLPWWLLVAAAAATAAAVPLALWGAVIGIRWVNDYGRYVTPSNATVTGELVTVASVNAGRVAAIRPVPGTAVRRGDTLVEVELAAPVRTTATGTAVMAFLGSTEQQVAVTAPVDGVVATVLVTEGSAVTAGQPVLRLNDPARLRVTAYVSEADIQRVRPGQEAEVHFAVLDRTLRGTVDVVVPATTGAVASAPTPAPSGEARAAGALYPVLVRVDLRDAPHLLGSSAEVRIRVQ